MTLALIENKDGTFNWMSWLLVNSSTHREAMVLTCQVEHDRQPAVTKNHTLEVSAHQKDQGTHKLPGEDCTVTDPIIYLFLYNEGSTSCFLLNNVEVNRYKLEL